MRRIFAYHYDQMQRELSAEIFNTPTDYQDNSDANILYDHLVSDNGGNEYFITLEDIN